MPKKPLIKPKRVSKLETYNSNIVTAELELKKKSKKTSIDECNELKIWDKLREVLLAFPLSSAISANQIGILKRAILLFIKEDGNILEEVKFVNPVILDAKDNIQYKNECCLSYPGREITTQRHNWIEIRDDINGKKEYNRHIAVLLQHKVDHLNGVLLHERAVVKSVNEIKKVGKNHPCPCRSGKKYKNCHMKIKKGEVNEN